MALSAGTRLARYEIVGPLGAGGMGEVYRARDTRLGRDVALKTLPPEVADHPDRMQRFEQEARAVAALNHPNIVALYDIGEGFLFTELVDGEPLRGNVGLAKALDIAGQIATGIAAAHDAGIVHRDLKPGNVLLRRDGQIKILDFGLAKATPRQDEARIDTATIVTNPGTVVGTSGYMSPEQVRGAEVDGRSDIFNIGLILYELLSGRRAFHAKTGVETMAAILREDPPALPENVPVAVRRVVAHCLEKDPANRFQSARDLAFSLAGCIVPPAAPERPASRKWVLPGAAAACLALAIAGVAIGWRARPMPPSWDLAALGGPEVAWRPRISPDGRTIAMLALVGKRAEVAIMRPDAGDWSILTANEAVSSAIGLCWSADGSRIYFDRFSDVPQGIYSVPVVGGPARLLLEKAVDPEALPDGSILASKTTDSGRHQLIRFWPETGRVRDYPYEVSLGAHQPFRAVPGGRKAVFAGVPTANAARARPRLYVLDLESGEARVVSDETLEAATLAVTRDGRNVLYSTPQEGVRTVPLDGSAASRAVLPVPARVYGLDAGPDGSIVLDQVDRRQQLFRLRAGHAEAVPGAISIIAPTPTFAILPDGRAAANYTLAGKTRLVGVAAGSQPSALIATADETSTPACLIGQKHIAGMVGPAGSREVAVALIATGSIVRRFAVPQGEVLGMSAPADGKTIYFAANHSVWRVGAFEAGPAIRICDGDAVAADPDGRYLAVVVHRTSGASLNVVPLDGGQPRVVPMPEGSGLSGLLSPGALDRDGRLLVGIIREERSWFYEPAVVDLNTSHLSPIPTDAVGDYLALNWTKDGGVMAIVAPLHSSVYRAIPEKR